ncbi:MAG: hypothetical protein EA378_07955 [Phycisphaerales bacterium]|nr:MAG: hypothetical protein EA378_07955 [Phycisphaerales bacterium]
MNLRHQIRRFGAALACVAGAMLATDAHAQGQNRGDREQTIAIKADTVHLGNGETIENGVVLIVGGKIAGVGPGLAIPRGATVIEVERSSVTPGLIDAYARLERVDPFDAARRESGRGRLAEIVRRMHGDHETGAFACTCTGFDLCPAGHMHFEYEVDGVTCPLCAFPNHMPMEAASGLVSTASLTESSSEVVAHTSVLDSINLRGADFDRLAGGGVTTVFVSPDSAAVIGPRGAIVRTGGPVRGRVVEEQSAVQAAMNSDTFRFGPGNNPPFRGFVTNQTRRPNTRMGVTWVFRKAFYDSARHAEGLPVSGADTAPLAALDVLHRVRVGEVPLRVHARQKNDIESAFRMGREFGLSFTLLEATEAYELIDLLKDADATVVFGPIEADPTGPRRFTPEARRGRLGTFRELLDAGVRTALTAQDLRDENGLARQAMYAVWSGVSPGDALRAVTLTPAEILGIDDRVGSIEAGKDADLVVWSGEPLDPTSRPLLVLINGRVEVDRR